MKALRALALSAIATGASVVPALAQYPGYYGGYGGHMWGDDWHGWLFGPLMMVLWLVVVVGAVVLVLRWIGASGHSGAARGARRTDAMEILRERFARGEIDKAEFEERKSALER